MNANSYNYVENDVNVIEQLPTRRWDAGEIVFEQGELGRLMYWIKSGEAEVLVKGLVGECQVVVLGEDDFFGEMGLLEALPRSATIRALTNMVVVEINNEAFDRLLVRQPEFLIRMLRKLARRLSQAQSELAIRSLPDESGRQETGSFDAATLPGISPEQLRHQSRKVNAHLIFQVTGQAVKLPNFDSITIGRSDPATGISPDVDLTFLDSQQTLSRRHAKILLVKNQWFLEEELGTVNGTFVNGRKLQPGKACPIQEGDMLTLGLLRLSFVV